MPNLTGTRWAQTGSSTVVTWSITDAGLSGVTDTFQVRRSDFTTDPQDTLNYSADAVFRSAFASWASVANIDFVQVADQGEAVGTGFGADIRISFGELDGSSGDTLGLAFFPTRGVNAVAGDILFDADEISFFSNQGRFLAVAAHEIGHTIGLDHITGVQALMNPRVSGITGPVADDIAGARQIYGENTGEIGVIRLSGRQPDLDILSRHDGLRVVGTSAENEISGARGHETLKGLGGNDLLMGRGGSDDIRGGGGRDQIMGGSGADFLNGNGGFDTVFGGGGSDLISGDGRADSLFGGNGQDTLDGGAGRDTLDGGGGKDVLTGGARADVFHFGKIKGRDVITDFTSGLDRLDFSQNVRVDDFGDLRIFSNGGGTVILEGDSGRIILQNTDPSDLSAGDFIF